MSDKPISVLVADDQLISREGWKRILETVPQICIVGEATTAQEAVTKTRDLEPAVLLVDLKWFGDKSAGASAIREIRSFRSRTRIIAVTAYEWLIEDARRAGADAALTKDFGREDLVGLIKELSARQNPFPTPTAALPEQLTERESEVLTLVAVGDEDKQIAAKLGIAESTAKSHVQNIISKLGAKNRTHAVSVAREYGLLA